MGIFSPVRKVPNIYAMPKPFLLISNDDGVNAPGLHFLVETLKPVADLLVVAPDGPRSGFSCSITSTLPLCYHVISDEPGCKIVSCTGTPTDCVKLALNAFPDCKPDLVVGGINHGDNSSVNTHYSGTMGVVIEGALQGYPAIAFSLCNHSLNADFSPLAPYIVDFVFKAIAMGMPEMTCLNVNFPDCPSFAGVRICRMAHSRWEKELEERTHPWGKKYYWLVGNCRELEPEAEDTDRWALAHGYVAITPTNLDVTAHGLIPVLRELLM